MSVERERFPSLPALAATGLVFGLSYWVRGLELYAWVGLAPLYWLTRRLSPKPALLAGTVFGAFAYGAAMPYFFGALEAFFKAPASLTAFLFAAMTAAHGLFFGLLAGIVRWLAPRLAGGLGGRRSLAFALASVPAAVSLEAVFPSILPWHFVSAQTHLPMLQSLAVFGPAGPAWLMTSFNAAVFVLLLSVAKGRRLRWGFLYCMAAVLAVNEGWGFIQMRRIDAEVERARREGKTFTAALIQGAGPLRDDVLYEKVWGNLEMQNKVTAAALASGPADLVIWPESSYGGVVWFKRAAGRPAHAFVEGVPLEERLSRDIPFPFPRLLSVIAQTGPAPGERRRRYNAALLADAGGRLVDLVEKSRLLPFGEYLPFGERLPFLYRLRPGQWHLYPAPRRRLMETGGGIRLGILICYEDFFTGCTRETAAMGAEVLMHLTNDAWFGEGLALEQHLRFARLRAVETRRFLVKAANTGVTAFVDPVGRIAARLETGRPGYLIGPVVPLDLRPPYLAVGDLLYWLAVLSLLLLAVFARRDGSAETSSGPRMR